MVQAADPRAQRLAGPAAGHPRSAREFRVAGHGLRAQRRAADGALSWPTRRPALSGGFTLTGTAGSLEPGEHTLVNLLDPGDTLDITVTPAYEITGLSLAGREVAVYEFDGANGVDPGDDPPPDRPPARAELPQSVRSVDDHPLLVAGSVPRAARRLRRRRPRGGRAAGRSAGGGAARGDVERDGPRGAAAERGGVLRARWRPAAQTRTSKMMLVK